MNRLGCRFELVWMLAAGAAVAACGSETPGGGDDLVVTLTDGKVQGDLAGGARVFLKIPFARPPVGDLRWKAPVKNDPWAGIRHETAFAEACPQDASLQSARSRNEDCLYLNVWSPEPAPTNAPVMVWFHGGGNITGSAGDDVPLVSPTTKFYNGQFFAAQHGVVVVTTNYRLGVLGFFAHPALATENMPVGNQGLLDQHRVLEWVRDNIASFGGNPSNVTIFGESAGATDVCYHVASPLDRGLFHRAISESGGCTIAVGGRDPTPGEPALQAGMQAFASSKLGCGDSADAGQLACLRAKTVDQLLIAAPQPDLTSGTGLTGWVFIPVVDGTFLPASARSRYDAQDIARVPYLLGTNSDEGTLFLLTATVDSYPMSLQAMFGAACAPKIATCYPQGPSDTAKAALARVIGDARLICPTRDTAVRADQGTVYLYNFNVVPAVLNGLGLGASHGSEIPFVFHDDVMASPAEQSVADAMNAYWAQFAKTGDPNFAGAPAVWPLAFGSQTESRLQFDSKWQVLTGFHSKQCAFWETVYAHPDCGAAVDPSVCN